MTGSRRGCVTYEVADAQRRNEPVNGSAIAPWPPPSSVRLPETTTRGVHELTLARPGGGSAPTLLADPVVEATAAQRGEAARANRWPELILLLGLAGVYLANAAVAWREPASFNALVRDSWLGRWLHLADTDWLAPLISVNDVVVGVAVLASIWSGRAPRRLILAWAGVWLLAVTVLKLTALDLFASG